MTSADPPPAAGTALVALDDARWAKIRDALVAHRSDVRRRGLRTLVVFVLYLACIAWAAHWIAAAVLTALVLVPATIYALVQRWKLRRLRRETPNKQELALKLYARMLDVQIRALTRWRKRAVLNGVALLVGVAAVIALTGWEIFGAVPARSADITHGVFGFFQATYAVIVLQYVAIWRRHRRAFARLVQEREELAALPGAPPMPSAA